MCVFKLNISVKLIILLAPFDQIEGLTKENMSYIKSQDHSKAHFDNQHFTNDLSRGLSRDKTRTAQFSYAKRRKDRGYGLSILTI